MFKPPVLTRSPDSQVVLQLDKVNKIFNAGTPLENHVLHDISLQVSAGELVALVGTSGSGKSTLLNVVGLLDVSSSGELRIQGHLTQGMSEQQRVAIARALVTRPALVLADEPTGNLDTQTADEVFSLFERFNVEHQCAIVIVTHDPRLSSRCPRTIRLSDGRIVYDGASADFNPLND